MRCLRTLGNVAVMGGRTTELFLLGFPAVNEQNFQGFTFVVEDRSALGMPDEISFQFIVALEVNVCPAPNPFETIFPLTQGNLVVHDG